MIWTRGVSLQGRALWWGSGILTGVTTCLVTGGAGFLGSHLCDELIARGNRVICVDNFETGSLANIEHIRDPDRFVHVGADIIEPYFVEEPIDFVYHLASPASPLSNTFCDVVLLSVIIDQALSEGSFQVVSDYPDQDHFLASGLCV